jgi:hypothetical protein
MRRILPSTVFALMLLWGTAMAQVPDNMHIQGNIAATAGEPLEGAHDLRFEIYDNNTGGNLLWSETHIDVAFANGYYSATLGAQGSPMTFSALAFSQSLWLEITIDGSDVLAPRTPLLASAYSMTARSVFGVSNIFPAEGNAAVGSTTPGVEPGAGKYFTISAAPSGIPNNYASLELQGGQGFIGDPMVASILSLIPRPATVQLPVFKAIQPVLRSGKAIFFSLPKTVQTFPLPYWKRECASPTKAMWELA